MIKYCFVTSNRQLSQWFQSHRRSHVWPKNTLKFFPVQYLDRKNRLLSLKSRHRPSLSFLLPLMQVADTNNHSFIMNSELCFASPTLTRLWHSTLWRPPITQSSSCEGKTLTQGLTCWHGPEAMWLIQHVLNLLEVTQDISMPMAVWELQNLSLTCC